MNVLDAVGVFESLECPEWEDDCPIDLLVRGNSIDSRTAWAFTAAATTDLSGLLEDVESEEDLADAFRYGTQLIAMGTVTDDQLIRRTKTVFLAYIAWAERIGLEV